MRAECVGCAESGLSRVLRGDEVMYFVAAKPDAIDLRNDGESRPDRNDRTGVFGPVARNPDGIRLFPAAGLADAPPRFAAVRVSLLVSHLIHGR